MGIKPGRRWGAIEGLFESRVMGPIDFFWHLVNLLAVPALLGLMAAAGARGLFWRRRLAAVSARRLLLATAAAAMLAALAALPLFGRDGGMAGYGLMVLAVAAVLGLALVRGRR
jgi:hypothetical protein